MTDWANDARTHTHTFEYTHVRGSIRGEVALPREGQTVPGLGIKPSQDETGVLP